MASPTQTEKVLEEHDRYRIVLDPDQSALLLDWKRENDLGLKDFRSGVAEFAFQCKTHTPARALIDASRLNPNGTSVGWVSGRETPSGEEEYGTWWVREIVPVYNDAGITGLAVVIGDPNAPGELPDLPPEVNFRMGYFSTVEAAAEWNVD